MTRLWRIAGTGVLLIFAFIYATHVPWGSVATQLRSASLPWTVAAVCAFALSVVTRAGMWWCFTATAGVRSYAVALRAMIAGMTVDSIVVGSAGEAARIASVHRATDTSASSVAATIVLERLMVTGMHVIMALIVSVLFTLPPSLARFRSVAVVLLAVMVCLVMLAARSPAKPHHRAGRLRRAMTQFGATLRHASSARTIAVAVPLAFAWWLLNAVTFHWCARAAGFDVPWSASTIAFLMVSAGTTVRTTPANVGVTQLVYVASMGSLGHAGNGAVGTALLIQAVQTLPVFAAACVLALVRRPVRSPVPVPRP